MPRLGPRKSNDPIDFEKMNEILKAVNAKGQAFEIYNQNLEVFNAPIELECKKFNPSAIIPTKAHPTDAAWDLYAWSDFTLTNKHGENYVGTGIGINIPSGYMGMIKDRSSMGKQRFGVHGGVIDSGYTGEIVVILQVHGQYAETGYRVRKGDKVAQLVILPIPETYIKEVEEFTENYSDRGTKGFGASSGR